MKRIPVYAVLVFLLVPVAARAADTSDLLAVVAMPLAVAGVSESTDVTASELIEVVTLMNVAGVAPAQFIEVVRYAPIALESDRNGEFVAFLRTRTGEGMRGDALVSSIERQLRAYGEPEVELTVTRPRLDVYDEDAVVPRVVREHRPK